MPKKKKQNKKQAESGSAFKLPKGFWAQTGAILLFLLAALLVVTWFQSGGPVLDWVQKEVGLKFFGFASFAIPVVLIYLGIAIFKDENNKLPSYVYVASLFLAIFLAGLFDIIIKSDVKSDASGGGLIGKWLNIGLLQLVVANLAVIIYLVLIAIDVFLLSRATYSGFVGWLKSHKQKIDSDGFKKREVNDKSNKPKAEFEIINETGPLVQGGRSDGDDGSDVSTKPQTSLPKSSASSPSLTTEKTALVSIQDPNWQMPPINLLGKKQNPADAGDVKKNARVIQDTLHEFGIDVEMTGASIGPKVTQYSLMPDSGVKLSKIAALENNLALNLAAQSLRIEAPIPGKRAVGIEVPNVKAADVRIRGIISSPAWSSSAEKMTFAVGRDTAGQAIVCGLSDLPHALIAGQTGSGKSVMINSLLVSLLYRNSPSDLKLILVDPKQVEMAPYQDIPHLLTPIITEPEKTLSALKWAVSEMERRYNLLAKYKKKDIKSYNAWINEQGQDEDVVEIEEVILEDGSAEHEGAMPYVVIVIDELSDLMMAASRDVEALIVRIAQKARAVGIHLVLATQRPSVNVVTGLIKANIPARFAFTTASQVDSKTILDRAGAEKLLGKGDMLMLTASMSKPKRVQGAWVSDEEVLKVTDFLRAQSSPKYDDAVVAQEVHLNGRGSISDDFAGADDDLIREAIKVVIDERRASVSYLQQRLRIGYNRAARLMTELVDRGIVSQPDGSKPREILVDSVDDLIL